MQLTNFVKAMRLKPDGTNYTAAAGSSDATSEFLDTAGYDGVRFLVGFGAITTGAVTGIRVQQATASGGSYADLEGTAIVVADDDDNLVASIEIVSPRERYLKVVTDRATQNAVVDFLVAELYRASKQPVTQDATIISAEIHASPAEGTA